jgi:hypothetical protein
VIQVVKTNETAALQQFTLLNERLDMLEDLLSRLRHRVERMMGNAPV